MNRNYVDEYMNSSSTGGAGMAFEVALREMLKGVSERCHGARETDISVKTGVALECKSGCGWLLEPGRHGVGYDSRAEAEMVLAEKLNALHSGALNGWQVMPRALHVAYAETFDGVSLDNVRIMSQHRFLTLLDAYNLIRIKQSRSSGRWGFAIQSYIPTPKFRASRKRYEAFAADRERYGMTITEYVERFCQAPAK